MLVDDFDYHLPEDRIAQDPAPRGASRLLVVDGEGEGRHRRIGDLPDLLAPGDLLVVNDTRVIPARLFAQRVPTGGKVELLLAERIAESEWICLVKPGRKARPGSRLRLHPELEAEVTVRGEDGRHTVRFSRPIEPLLDEIGHVPLPPYIHRPDNAKDRSRYQTVFARHPGAIAAPTAGLHFSDELLGRLEASGVEMARVTLHVGLGTFKPITAELVHEHRMDEERYHLPPVTVEAIARTRACGGAVVAVGTTVVRTLEGVAAAHGGRLVAGDGRTNLFIHPGHRFAVVDRLLTNFHLPRSTLLMLVCALAGRERVLAAYNEAVAQGYRFYSYGDAMLVRRQ